MKMNRTFPFLLAIFILATAACANASAANPSSTTSVEGSPDIAQENTMDPIYRLALGTFFLENTALAVQAEQADQLLPLWQVYQTLVNSDTASQVEISALENQIQETMLAEQMEAIEAMQFDNEDLGELFQTLGLNSDFGGRMGAQGTPGAEISGTPFPIVGQGGMPQAVMPGDRQGFRGMAPEGMPEMQGQVDPSLQTTRQAQMASRQNMKVNPMLLNALIELLQGKILQ
jgi:hypothetical protein